MDDTAKRCATCATWYDYPEGGEEIHPGQYLCALCAANFNGDTITVLAATDEWRARYGR